MLSYTEVQNQSGIDPPVIKENNGHYELSFLKWGGCKHYRFCTQNTGSLLLKNLPSWTSQTLCYSGDCSHYWFDSLCFWFVVHPGGLGEILPVWRHRFCGENSVNSEMYLRKAISSTLHDKVIDLVINHVIVSMTLLLKNIDNYNYISNC